MECSWWLEWENWKRYMVGISELAWWIPLVSQSSTVRSFVPIDCHWVEWKITVLHHELWTEQSNPALCKLGQSFEDQLLSVLLEARSRRYGSGASVESLLTFFCEVNIGESETQLGPTRSGWKFHLDTELHHCLPDPKRSISLTDNTIEVRWAADQMVPPVEVAFSDMENTLPSFNSKDQHQSTKRHFSKKGLSKKHSLDLSSSIIFKSFFFNTLKAISLTSVGLLLCSSTAARLLEASLGQRIFGGCGCNCIAVLLFTKKVTQSVVPVVPIFF